MENLKGKSDLEDTNSALVTSLPQDLQSDLRPSLSGSFMNLSFKDSAKSYYDQFGDDVQERFFLGADGRAQAGFVAFSRKLYQKDRGEVKVLFVVNARTANTRGALVGWSEKLLPEVLKLKKELSCDYALFFLSRRERGLFNFFIRPRKKREDQIRFSHLRGVGVQIVQGQKLFPESPLEHIEIRTATEADLIKLQGYIKQSSKHMPLSRYLEAGSLKKSFDAIKGFSLDDLALAFNSKGEIVGSLGAIEVSSQVDFKFKFNEVLEPTFFALQTYLKIGAWFTDLRPVNDNKEQRIKFFTHMYFNNHDVFYALICWWMKKTKLLPKKERPLFLYPFYKGDLKAAPHSSLFSSGFKGDLYLMQEAEEQPSELLKPVLFSESLDIDLPLLI